MAKLQAANFQNAQLKVALLGGASMQGAMLHSTQLQGVSLVNAQLQGTVFFKPQLAGVNFSGAKLDHVLILEPLVEAVKVDDHLVSRLDTARLDIARSAEVDELRKQKFAISILLMKRITKKKTLPKMSKATLEIKNHRCLLLTDNKELQNSATHVCDNASDLSIDPLVHLRDWAKYNVRANCKHNRSDFAFVSLSTTFTTIVDIRKAYTIVKDYRTRGSKHVKLQQASEALKRLAHFLFTKQSFRIHKDKQWQCKARPQLDYWYQLLDFENDPQLMTRILNLKLKPFPTSAEH